jgi:CRISPR type III-A-associated RAMP protein Csm4
MLKDFAKGHPRWRHSDLLPYVLIEDKATPLLPKPLNLPKKETTQANKPLTDEEASLKKQAKNVSHVTPDHWMKLYQGERLSQKDIKAYAMLDDALTEELQPQVSVRGEKMAQGEATPYSVAYTWVDKEKVGLWCLFDRPLPNDLKQVIEYLGEVEGLGGKRSSGAGRFSVCYASANNAKAHTLQNALQQAGFSLAETSTTGHQLALSACIPTVGEARGLHADEQAGYTVVMRRGFHYSVAGGWPGFVKKRPVAMLQAGSWLPASLQGQVLDVTPSLNEGKPPHQLYRYGLALGLQVKGI